MAAMRQLCTSAYLLDAGGLVMSGETNDVIRTYLNRSFSGAASDLTDVRRTGAGEIRFTSMRWEDESGSEMPGLASGHAGRIVLGLSAKKAFTRVRACIAFLDTFEQRVHYLNSYFVGDDLAKVEPGTNLVCEIPRVALAPGRYRVQLWLQTSGTILQDRIPDAGIVDVVEGNFFGTGKAMPEGTQLVLTDYSWRAQAAASETEEAASESLSSRF
jgi:lipopolysaccharide transport system ATP-binding protein